MRRSWLFCIIITSNQGEVKKDNCNYTFYSDKGGTVRFTVSRKNAAGLIKLQDISFKIKGISKPEIKSFTGKSRVPLSEILSQDTDIVAGPDISSNIKEFTVIVLYRQTGTFKTILNKTGKLSDDTKRLLQDMKPEDSMIFQQIIAADRTGKDKEIESRMITVY